MRNYNLSAKEFKIISLDNFGKLEQIKFQDESAAQKITIKKYSASRSFPVPLDDLIHFYAIDPVTGISSKKPLLRVSFVNQKENTIVFLKLTKKIKGKLNMNF